MRSASLTSTDLRLAVALYKHTELDTQRYNKIAIEVRIKKWRLLVEKRGNVWL